MILHLHETSMFVCEYLRCVKFATHRHDHNDTCAGMLSCEGHKDHVPQLDRNNIRTNMVTELRIKKNV